MVIRIYFLKRADGAQQLQSIIPVIGEAEADLCGFQNSQGLIVRPYLNNSKAVQKAPTAAGRCAGAPIVPASWEN